MSFEDNFSRQAGEYARHRPGYSPELFAFIASLAPAHELAWDCGTGSGQAAHGMAEHFARVIATDASSEQIAHAHPHDRITYRVSPAEHTDIAPASIDAISVATALHWFDLEGFYAEAQRVLKPGGAIAVWSYFNHTVDDPAVDRLIHRFGRDIVGPYWSQKLTSMNRTYEGIAFPFEEVTHPEFVNTAKWRLDDMIGYLCSWSATQAFAQARGYHPMDTFRDELAAAWGDPETIRTVRWPLTMRVGRKGVQI